MESEYDRKFEEMKKYIPFLESMIKRLESTSSASANPRQAQLDKIRSLRDLLLDQKKRMKMENLLKCEQVLVNLYAKVEQRDTQNCPASTSTPSTTKPAEANDLEKVRNKLKSVVNISRDESQDTLPEIARANIVEETCTPGSKEPALFQRRPNKTSLSPGRNLQKSPIKPGNPTSKRNYTRVLLSPEPSSRRWENNDKTEKPLFSRRSPRRSPKRSSPTYNKKERKKAKQKQAKKGKDLNITLNVPEESLNSLNSKDILSRIMNCNDNDVDIETLREAKRQILNELKQTGAKCDDISDLLLKSYKKRGTSKKQDDVEEGELSDSESEAISSIYDNFILDDSNANSSKGDNSETKEKPRKIQICLVINSDKDATTIDTNNETSNVPQDAAVDDFEMYDKNSSSIIKDNLQDSEKNSDSKNVCNQKETINDNVVEEQNNGVNMLPSEFSAEDQVTKCNTEENKKSEKPEISEEGSQPANFYKPLKNDKHTAISNSNDKSLEVKEPIVGKNSSESEKGIVASKTDAHPEIATYLISTENEEKKEVEIPLLHDQSVATRKPKKDVVSEIDILQALKNEILGEPISIPESETTPLMHQPKLTKVASVQEIVPKKRISIEKYKKKSVSSVSSSTSLFINDPLLSLNDDSSMSSKEDNTKKQSLKLTEKECERFNFPTKLALDDDDDLSDEDLESDFSVNDIYENLAPKSPDNKETPNVKTVPPVIIPVDPIKTVTPSKLDVDMRTLTPNIIPPSTSSREIKQDKSVNKPINTHVDPRMRRDLNQSADKDHSALPRPVPPVSYSNAIPNPTTSINPSMTPKRSPLLMTPIMHPNATPNRVPNMTPNRVPNMTPSMAPNMTPSRNPNMTPNSRQLDISGHQLEVDDNSTCKHVYAPMFPIFDQGDSRERSLAKEQERRPHWDQHEKDKESRKRDSHLTRDPRATSVHRETSVSRYNESHNNYDSRYDRRDNYSRGECPRTPVPSFGRSDAPMTPIHPFGRSDCPQTPSHPFGRSDCPLTPSHPFGRSDCPLTPSHPFGRSDCPPTPNHPFGRPDYSRNEGSMTPIHTYGRLDMPSTPSHPFGRSETHSRDPRLNRISDQDNYHKDDTDHMNYRDRKRSSYNNSYRSESSTVDSYRSHRERSVGRNERSIYSEHDSHHYSNDQTFRRDSSDGRAMSRDFDNDRLFSRDRGHGYQGNESQRKNLDNDSRKGFIRERSIGRGESESRMHPASYRRVEGRALSIGRSKDDTENRLRVKPDIGSSFMIDTSIRSTFQEFMRDDKIQVFENTFDDRRRRASSVGRTLCRESSVGRSLPNQQNSMCSTREYSDRNPNQSNFRRARSVGRDILTSEKERSFNDLKEDFRNFSKQNMKWLNKFDTSQPKRNDISPSITKINTTRKDVLKKLNTEPSNKKPYSPRKNYRDPRMRRELQSFKNKYKYENTREREQKNVGIVYSNDNITKGTILGSGYGVKNYKIPKIKRPVEEQKLEEEEANKDDVKVVKESKKKEEKRVDSGVKKNVAGDAKASKKKENKNIDMSVKKTAEDNKIKNIKNKVSKVDKTELKMEISAKETLKTNEEPEKRVTRLSKKSELSSPSCKTKRTRKSIIDSDSDLDQYEEENKDTLKWETPSITSCTERSQPDIVTSPSIPSNLEQLSKAKEIVGKQDIECFETALQILSNTKEVPFGIDDLESFSDNLASDPVIDNINALIADLDNDIGPAKLETNEKDNVDTLKHIKNVIEDVEPPKISSESPKKKDTLKESMGTDITKPVDNKVEHIKTSEAPQASELDDMKTANLHQSKPASNDNTVSTTDTKKESISENKENEKLVITEGSPIPDSTNEVSKNPDLDDSLPDSTNEAQTDINALVTSSHDSLDDVNKNNLEPCSSNKEVTSNNSIDNILSILKNKSKLKEIFSMLGDQSSENEKIKKKLEKLCAIVSDEDDDVTENPVENSTLNSSGDSSSKDNEKEIILSKNVNDSMEEHNLDLDADKILERSDDNKESSETVLEINTENINDIEMDENILQKETGTKAPKKQSVKRGKITKRGKGRQFARGAKRITRSAIPKVKKPSRELLMLQEDLKEMFISDDVLNATGIRMCRIAKLVDDNNKSKDDVNYSETGPVVLLEKFKDMEAIDEVPIIPKVRKKPGPKPKIKPQESIEIADKSSKIKPFKYRPGPKSKTKQAQKSDDEDPYAFESDSVSENNESVKSIDHKERQSSDSENDSLSSSQSFGSTELLVELKKKPKRKRSSWQTGVIRPKNRKKKSEQRQTEIPIIDNALVPKTSVIIPDPNCFTDKSYCFHKNILTYSCRLCSYNGDDIVNHFKQQHPHSEIPLSRLSPEMAKEAIEQCEEINFQAISKIPSEKYVCRFCFKEFGKKCAWNKNVLEDFFWHVVSMHTGEYKQSCSCVNIAKCPFNLDIPPPPKDIKGQLIGYICEKCNFTQISLENLKTHVIVRHNDEQTEVYTINLAVMSRKALTALTRRSLVDSEERKPEQIRVLRSTRSNQSATETSDDQSDVTDTDQPRESIKSSKEFEIAPNVEKKENTNLISKISFENDDSSTEASNSLENLDTAVKNEPLELANNKEIEVLKNNLISEICGTEDIGTTATDTNAAPETTNVPSPVDINDCAHFKISYTDSGSKEYACCVNGVDHYRTALLISMKKHVQSKHAEIWDGFCVLCKVIVMPQGRHHFKECLQHYLDKHMDNFPVIEKVQTEAIQTDENQSTGPAEVQPSSPKPYINVRPLSELISKEIAVPPLVPLEIPALPKIENVMSLGPKTVEPSQASPSYPRTVPAPEEKKVYKYEEVQAEVMSKKHRVVLDTMMSVPKLVNIFKCAGRYCSFTSDSAEEALVHASTHKRVGGESSLICAYCDFDCSGNAIDLVMHVFKAHGSCPFQCGYCFYRAAASQLVSAHISRLHKDAPLRVLTVANATPPPVKDASMLSRETVVQYYICPHACKFKAYTAGKFCEHLVAQHPSKNIHRCYNCEEKFQTPHQLVQHMKSHQINVYQCTSCVHGADSETGLLLHAAHTHPDSQPQAYLRVIQKLEKGGSTQLRVLPLVSFNKSKVNVEVVAPAVITENAVREAEREAERSIELEKLIGHTTQLIDAMAPSPIEPIAPPPEAVLPATETESAVTSIMAEAEMLTDPPEPSHSPAAAIDPASVGISDPPLVTPPPPVTPPPSQEKYEQVTPKIKSEPIEKTPTKILPTEIVCLDSDDENDENSRDSRASVIALSDDEAPETPTKDKEGKHKIIQVSLLLKCPTCLLCYKGVGGFKRHTNQCIPLDGRWICPHCGFHAATRETLVNHYLRDHSDEKRLHICSLCDLRAPSLSSAKSHMRTAHNVYKIVIKRKETSEDTEYLISPASAPAAATKRKRSSSAAVEPPAKMKRFGPLDVDKLPINPIMDELVSCSLCEFSTKVRVNMVRHLQAHAEQQSVPQTAPVNPVPHLETNEMHFDRMVNLASSSIVTRAPEKPSRQETATVSLLIPPEAASRYPKYVPDRQRHTCGAKGCSYISVDEAMLRCHWETLHSGTNDFHCVHCPPYQHLDTSKPLTAARIIAHLKMHDATLYACSSCVYYHYKKQLLEKHLSEVHKGSGRVMVVREEVISSAPGPLPPGAPTMDLKPWQCGLCSYKSMLRPDVAEHCSKSHQSKMQYKCFYCPFRTSALENVTKHQTNAHPKKAPEVFYYYYREGSILDEPDGTPRWVKQRQKFSSTDPEVKSETTDPSETPSTSQSLYQLLATPAKPPPVDLNIVKKEVEDSSAEISVEQLLAKFGQVCEPNGLRYKCPLCKVVTEDTKEAMQSHLYEELKYRKWVCAKCAYKAFHLAGLNKHIESEHRGQTQKSIELPLDLNIEKWVEHILQYQGTAIEKNRENFSKQKIIIERPPPSTSVEKAKPTPDTSGDKFSMTELEQAFGPFGVPSNMMFCCPKCSFMVKDEAAMKDHLEMELSKIRWCCSNCADKFQTYHEAQFHCKSVHTVATARPVEAPRAPPARAAWAKAALRVQRLTMNCQPAATDPAPSPTVPTPAPVDDLLVVRYEEPAPTPIIPAIPQIQLPRKRNSPPGGSCKFCPFKTRYDHVLRDHTYRHYKMKPFACSFCDFNGHRSTVADHIAMTHGCKYKPEYVRHAVLPDGPPPPEDPKVSDLKFPDPKISEPDARKDLSCDRCGERFKLLIDLKNHHAAAHGATLLKYSVIPHETTIIDSDDEMEIVAPKRVARKSTTKLPNRTVARKSTTKLPYDAPEDPEEYSYYGTRPLPPSEYEDVTTMMSFCNTMVPFTVKKLSEVIKIDPRVRVENVARKRPAQ